MWYYWSHCLLLFNYNCIMFLCLLNQALSEAVANINAALQPNLRTTLKLSAFRPVHVPSAHPAAV